MTECDEMPVRKCGDMTFASYLARRCGKCKDQVKEETIMPVTNYNEYIDRLMESIGAEERERNNKMKITHGGVTIEGSSAEVAQIAGKLGIPLGEDGVWYNSTSRGYIRIAEMNEEHLQRAITKRYRLFAESLKGLTGTAFIQAYNKQYGDPTVRAMVQRLAEINTDKALNRSGYGVSRSPVKW